MAPKVDCKPYRKTPGRKRDNPEEPKVGLRVKAPWNRSSRGLEFSGASGLGFI